MKRFKISVSKEYVENLWNFVNNYGKIHLLPVNVYPNCWPSDNHEYVCTTDDETFILLRLKIPVIRLYA